MLFNSLDFAVFAPLVFWVYWIVLGRSMRIQNVWLLFVSYFFYACWDWRFLFLLMFSTLLDYYTGLKMQDSLSEGKRKLWFWLSVGINLGFLGVFKYYNFFAESFAEVFRLAGMPFDPWTLKVILPVGISFYTFHGLSYVIDIYNRRIPAERNFVDYSLFVSFFPLLVAGPIERATHLLPQIKQPRKFQYVQAVDGLRQILWGLFKKVVIADSCAVFVNDIFNHTENYSGVTLLLGAVFFAFQIYGDFSGYSDIALGTARMLGIQLLKNFSFPYFSRDIAEFWRRWHISLSSWFRDYLYIPLGGSQGGLPKKIRNTFVIFLVSGFWHGANWTFVAWGALNALYFLSLLISKTNRNNIEIVAKGRVFPTLKESIQMLLTFSIVVLAWVFFRSDSMSHALHYLSGMFTNVSSYRMPGIYLKYIPLLLFIFGFMTVEWFGREGNYALERLGLSWRRPWRWGFYLLLAVCILMCFGKQEQFIYFQF